MTINGRFSIGLFCLTFMTFHATLYIELHSKGGIVCLFVCVCAVLLSVWPLFNAFASDYISLVASGATTEHSVRKVSVKDGLINIGVWGGAPFNLVIVETYPADVVASWTYFDGSALTGMSLTWNADEYRVYAGRTVLKFNDNTYQYMDFRVCPAWDPQTPPSVNAAAPTFFSVISDLNARSLLTSASRTEIAGPTALQDYCCCDENQACCMLTALPQDEDCKNAVTGECDDSMC
jgi:hypothetical protein